MSDFEQDEAAWSSITSIYPGAESGRQNYGTSENIGQGVKAFLGVSVIRATGRCVGKIELNPSRVEDPSGWSLAAPAAALRSVEKAWPVVSEFMAPLCGPAEARTKRLDVARDFEDVTQPASVIRGLAPINRPWARRNLVHADPVRHGAQTLMVGSGAGIARLYDKRAETQGRAPAGAVRWESECRPEWLKTYGNIRYLSDVTPASCAALAINRWEWSAMGVEVAATSTIVEKVLRSGLSDREQTMFLGWLMKASAGHAWDAAPATMAKWRRYQRELGIAIVAGMFDDGDQGQVFTSRLDWESGREVLSVAV